MTMKCSLAVFFVVEVAFSNALYEPRQHGANEISTTESPSVLPPPQAQQYPMGGMSPPGCAAQVIYVTKSCMPCPMWGSQNEVSPMTMSHPNEGSMRRPKGYWPPFNSRRDGAPRSGHQDNFGSSSSSQMEYYNETTGKVEEGPY